MKDGLVHRVKLITRKCTMEMEVFKIKVTKFVNSSIILDNFMFVVKSLSSVMMMTMIKMGE